MVPCPTVIVAFNVLLVGGAEFPLQADKCHLRRHVRRGVEIFLGDHYGPLQGRFGAESGACWLGCNSSLPLNHGHLERIGWGSAAENLANQLVGGSRSALRT